MLISNVKLKQKKKKSGNSAYLSEAIGFNATTVGVGGWIDIVCGVWELVERSGRIGAWFDF